MYQKFQHSPWMSSSVTWAGQSPTNKSHTPVIFQPLLPTWGLLLPEAREGVSNIGESAVPQFYPQSPPSLSEPKFSRKTEVLGCPKILFGFFCKIIQKTRMNFLTNPKDLRCDSRNSHEHQFCLNPYLIFQHIFFLLLAKSRAWLCY